jgi:hypothetical protein
MPLPQTITIGAIEYAVKPVQNLHSSNGDLYGQISYSAMEIQVDDQYTDCQRTPFILWHEVLHGILEQAGIDVKENVIVSLGYGVVEALKDNPCLRCNPPVESEQPKSTGE